MAEVNTSTKTGGTSENKNLRGRVFSAIWRVMLILLAVILAISACTLAYDKFVKKSKIPSN